MTTHQNVMKKLTLNGDFSIAGVNGQLPLLVQHLSEVTEIVPGDPNSEQPYEIDFRGVQALDACGCQLLAALSRSLKKRGVERFSLKLNDNHREIIHLFGFDNEIFTGECV